MIVQIFLFGFVGLMNTFIDIGAYLLLTRAFMVEPITAHVLSFLLGSLNSYIMNGRLTFRQRSVHLASSRRIVKFAFSVSLTLAISTALMMLLIGHVSDLAAKAVVTLATFLVGFIVSRVFVFN